MEYENKVTIQFNKKRHSTFSWFPLDNFFSKTYFKKLSINKITGCIINY